MFIQNRISVVIKPFVDLVVWFSFVFFFDAESKDTGEFVQHLWLKKSNWTIFDEMLDSLFFYVKIRYFCLCFIYFLYEKRIRICTKGRWFTLHSFFFVCFKYYLEWSDCSIWISSASILVCIDLVVFLWKKKKCKICSALFENELVFKSSGPHQNKSEFSISKHFPTERKSAKCENVFFSFAIFCYSFENSKYISISVISFCWSDIWKKVMKMYSHFGFHKML